MRKGFSFKGIHSNSMGVSVKTRSRPILPETKRVTFEPSVGDGTLDLSAYNSRGRVLYSERQFDIDVHAAAGSVTELQYKLTRLASWLSGSGELIFDDLPAVIWKASRSALIDYAPERAGKQAILSVSFFAEPFSYAPFTAFGGIPIGTRIPIGARVPIGLPATLVHQMSSAGTIDIFNIGTAPTRPVITINDPFGTYTVTVGGVSIEASMLNSAEAGALVIDCENYNVYAVNSADTVLYSGMFPELAAGENTIEISSNTSWSTSRTVSVDYLPRFLYGWEV